MRIKGIHLLVTYKCNSECSHCFLSCGSRRTGTLEFTDAKKIINDAKNISSINYFYIEGGEPFLFPKLALQIAEYATANGYWIGALSNGFWAKDLEAGKKILKPFKEAGLAEIGISTDKFHQEAIPLKYAKNAVRAAKTLGIDAYLMKTGLKDVRGRGRGAKICIGSPAPWQSFTGCAENLADPSRVHIGPNGSIHLCQALLIGQDARTKPLKEIFEVHLKKPNIIVEQLLKGGPAQLALFTQEFGFQPEDSYVQGCRLCFEARRYLTGHFPQILSPKENYL